MGKLSSQKLSWINIMLSLICLSQVVNVLDYATLWLWCTCTYLCFIQ